MMDVIPATPLLEIRNMSERAGQGEATATPDEAGPRRRCARERALRSDAKASRKTLVTAARDLFAERGPDGLTIVEVAKRAGLNRSTAYQHFRSREELTQAVAEDFAMEIREMLFKSRAASPSRWTSSFTTSRSTPTSRDSGCSICWRARVGHERAGGTTSIHSSRWRTARTACPASTRRCSA